MTAIKDIMERFSKILDKYNYYKKKNRYYYSQLKDLHRLYIPKKSKVLEIGCGTGDILKFVEPKNGLGIDVSPEMINTAKERYKDISFRVGDIEKLEIDEKFDYIIMANVIDHLTDVYTALMELKKVSHQDTKIIISSINPLWSIPLHIAEKLDMKTPEGAHNWVGVKNLSEILEICELQVIEQGWRFLMPIKIPKVSNLINSLFFKIPMIRSFGIIQFFVVKPAAIQNEVKIMSCSVIVPCYNEEENIKECIERIPEMGIGTEVIVVDDGSTDDTSSVVKKIMLEKKNVRLISYQKNRGKGYATREGLNASKGEILMILDADMAVPPEDLPKFYELIASGKAEFVNGTRMVYPMEGEAMRDLHIFGNKIFSHIFSYLLGKYVSDTLCGTKVFFRKDYQFMKMKEDAWPDFDLLFGASKLGLNIKEMPVRYREREAGSSKMKTFTHGFLLLKMCLVGFIELKLKIWTGAKN